MLLNFIILTTLLLSSFIECNENFQINEYQDKVVFTEHEDIMYDWLCLFENPKESCVFKNWSPMKRRNFNERRANFIIFVIVKEQMANYNTHSFYNMMHYYNAMGFTIISMIVDKVLESDDIVHLFAYNIYLFSKSVYHAIIQNKPELMCFKEYFQIENVDPNNYQDNALLEISINPKYPIRGELKLLANKYFHVIESKYDGNNSFIAAKMNKKSHPHKITLDDLVTVDTHQILIRAANWISPYLDKIEEVGDTESDWLFLSKNYVFQFADAVIVIMHHQKYFLLTKQFREELLKLAKKPTVPVIQISKEMFKMPEFQICKHIPEFIAPDHLAVYIFSHLLQDCRYIKKISDAYEYDDHMINEMNHFINRARMHRQILVDQRKQTFCSNSKTDYLGECYFLEKGKAILKKLNNYDGLPMRMYLRHRRDIVMMMFYKSNDPVSLYSMDLYHTMVSIRRSTSMINFLTYDLVDVQFIHVDCERFKSLCNESKITHYPTLKFEFNFSKKLVDYQGNLQNPAAIIRFIINHYDNPFKYTYLKVEYGTLPDLVGIYYENIFITIDSTSRKKLDEIKKAVSSNLLIVKYNLKEIPYFFKDYSINFKEIVANTGIWLNFKMKTRYKVNLTALSDSIGHHFQWLDSRLIHEISYFLLKKSIAKQIPSLIVFYYQTKDLTHILETFQNSFNSSISLFSADLSSNYYKVKLYQRFGCSDLPCFVLYHHDNSFETLRQTFVSDKDLIRWAKNILDKKHFQSEHTSVKLTSCGSNEISDINFSHYDFQRIDWIDRENFMQRDEFTQN